MIFTNAMPHLDSRLAEAIQVFIRVYCQAVFLGKLKNIQLEFDFLFFSYFFHLPLCPSVPSDPMFYTSDFFLLSFGWASSASELS